ncbi:hypothetical protein JCGZ_22955 [Jatropha curcas]|uniref:Uncharacterized protein n=1 Tax=Jatropha curcas TaxID=180498 RepID=A0A067L596_JATCU|nr:hypothetical protein JCGZ_22955 [Jatropha curcas]
MEGRPAEGSRAISRQKNHYLLKTTLYSSSINDFEYFGVRIAKFWVAWDFPATVHGGGCDTPARHQETESSSPRVDPGIVTRISIDTP